MVGINHDAVSLGTLFCWPVDVIIATKDSTIGMVASHDRERRTWRTRLKVGPMSFQVPTLYILVDDEAEAVAVAKKYLSYFLDTQRVGGRRSTKSPTSFLKIDASLRYAVIETLADIGSVLEVRKVWDWSDHASFALRTTNGDNANNPHHLSGAIDSEAADKSARFLKLCDAFDIPILSLMDCPGLMVGPQAEATALVRHSARMFNIGANTTTPKFGVVIRKAYGLGIQAMCGGSSSLGLLTVGWPTAEFAAMNIEGSIKLGFRDELMAIEHPEERLKSLTPRLQKRMSRLRPSMRRQGVD